VLKKLRDEGLLPEELYKQEVDELMADML